MRRAAPFILALIVTACAGAVSLDAGCAKYGQWRADMPRPLPDDALGAWVAGLDAAMTGACR